MTSKWLVSGIAAVALGLLSGAAQAAPVTHLGNTVDQATPAKAHVEQVRWWGWRWRWHHRHHRHYYWRHRWW